MHKMKRIASITGVILIFSLYLISLISAFTASKYANSFFVASVFCTIVIPIMLFAFSLIYKMVHKNDSAVNPNDADMQKKRDHQELSDKSKE